MGYRAIKLSLLDNVAVAVTRIPKNAEVTISDNGEVSTNEEIPIAHKIALIPISRGSDIIRYGEVICSATEDINVGDWVHVHNTLSNI